VIFLFNSLSQSDRTLIARQGAHAMHAKHDSKVTSAPGRQKFLSRFEEQVDPNSQLSSEERSRRAAHARKAYFAELALKSARARRARKGVDNAVN